MPLPVMAPTLASNQPSTMERVIHAYSEGASDVEIAKILGLTKAQFLDLEQENDGFAKVVARGRTLSEAWWYEIGRKGMTMEKFNGPLFGFNMKNRFGWADKVDTGDKSNEAPINQDEAAAQLRKALGKLAKKNPELLRDAGVLKDE